MIEVLASVVVVWQLIGGPGQRDLRAMRIIGAAFAALAVYVVFQAGRELLIESHPGSSALGTAWVAATVATMLLLAAGKHRTGTRLGNAVLAAEARVTLIDAYVAASVLLGLALNAAFGWWWSDPLAALVIFGYAVRESRDAFRWRPDLPPA